MICKFLIGLALASGLALGAIGATGPAIAQGTGFCSKFDSGLDGFGPCTDAPNVTVTTATDAGGITPTDPYLKITDLSGASRVCSSDPKYVGNWLEKMNGCGQLCFDFKVFDSGYPPTAITPSITIVGTGGRATFVAAFSIPIGDTSWHRNICAPIADGANPPTSTSGHWVVTGSWNTIITSVSMVQLPIDFSSSPSEVVGYDNICMTPGGCGVTPPPEIKGCLKDSKVAVKCNGDGTYTLTLTGLTFTGTDITLTSQTAGVTVTPPQQPWAATTNWTITGATPGQTVILTANATKIGGGKEPGTDECCSGEIKIVMPDCPKGDVVVEKKVENKTHASTSAINSLVFPIGLSCTSPANLNLSFGLPNSGTHTENNVPYTSVCTVTESTSTLPPAPPRACPQGFVAVWETPVIAPASATINAPVTAFTVLNVLDCKPVEDKTGVLIVEKKVQNNTAGNLTGWTYPITSTCGTPPTFSLPDGGQQTLNNIPLGTSCSISENTSSLPVPVNACKDPHLHPVWSTTYVPSSATIGTSPVTLTAVNTLNCEPLKPVCTPPLVPNAAGECVCPPPMIPGAVLGQCICPPGMHLVNGVCEGPPPPACPPPMVLNAAGVCSCPPGTVLRGKECVKVVIDCHPPMVPNAAGTSCVCPPGTIPRGGACVKAPPPLACKSPLVPNAAGTECVCRGGMVLRGRKCVEPIVCRPPAKLNRRGTACECPDGMTRRGNTCVERERRPQFQIPNGVPGIGFPNGGPRTPRGGGDNPTGPRGGQGGGGAGKP